VQLELLGEVKRSVGRVHLDGLIQWFRPVQGDAVGGAEEVSRASTDSITQVWEVQHVDHDAVWDGALDECWSLVGEEAGVCFCGGTYHPLFTVWQLAFFFRLEIARLDGVRGISYPH
jgi:hypothetical protein